jgi:hypothetical protein
MSSNEKNSKSTSSNNYFRKKGVLPVFKTLISSEEMFSDRMKKLDDMLRKARMFPR